MKKGPVSRRTPHFRYRKVPRIPAVLPKIFFCGDPHGSFDHIVQAVREHAPQAIILLGDLQLPAPFEVVFADILSLTQIWWIPGNHDSDTEETYDNLWHSRLAERNLHGRVCQVAGLRVAGLGGVFRGQIWMPGEEPNYQSVAGFVRRQGRMSLWRGGLPRRHRTSIFPSTYEALLRQKADILVTHEAASCHRKGFEEIDRLCASLHVRWHFHGHQHEDRDYGEFKGVRVRAVGYRGIVDLEGNEIVPAQLDPRDQMALQQAGEEPAPEVLDSVPMQPMTEMKVVLDSFIGKAEEETHYRAHPRRSPRTGDRSRRSPPGDKSGKRPGKKRARREENHPDD